MKNRICLLLVIMIAAVCAAGTAEEAGADLYMPYYRAAIAECERYDYMDYGDGAVGYQYAFVYLSGEDTIPALLLAEVSPDQVRYIKVFQYSPAEKRLLESLQPLNEYRAWLNTGKDGRGLLLWYSDGAYDAGILEVRFADEILDYQNLWRGANDGSWPADIPRTDISWTDVQKGAEIVFAPEGTANGNPAASGGPDEASGSSDDDLPDLGDGKLDDTTLSSEAVMGSLKRLLGMMGPFSIVSYDRSQEIDVHMSDDGTQMIVEANLDIRKDPENFVTYVRDLSPAGADGQ